MGGSMGGCFFSTSITNYTSTRYPHLSMSGCMGGLFFLKPPPNGASIFCKQRLRSHSTEPLF